MPWQRTELVCGDLEHRGRLTYRAGKVLERTKKPAVDNPSDDPWQYAGNLHPEIV